MIHEMVTIRGRQFKLVADTNGVSEHHGDHANMVARLVKVLRADGGVEWQRKS